MHREWLGGCNPVRHKSRRPRLWVGNATPFRGEGVPMCRKRPSATRLHHRTNLFNGLFPYISLSRRCHFQDVQYHYFGFRVSLGKANVYKVEARLNRDLSVSRPWHIFVLLTVVDTPLLCPTNRSPNGSLSVSKNSPLHESTKQCVTTPASTRSIFATIVIVARAAQAARPLSRVSRSLPSASAIPSR